MRISMIGQRGVPATFGGVERHVEELGSRLAAMGHEVTVYCRSNYVDNDIRSYRRMRLVHLPTLPTKHFDAIVHSGLAAAHAIRQGSDIVHLHALGPGLVAPLPKALSQAGVVLTVHGRDDRRAKWGLPARMALGTAAWMSGRVPHATITVSQELAASYGPRNGHRVAYIPNGVVATEALPPGAVLDAFGLVPGRYVLWVGRLVPEKAPDLLIRAFRQVPDPGVQLVIVGGSSFTEEFAHKVKLLADADPRVRLTGYQYGDALAELYSNAGVFALPSDLEGMPLTLLEAASYGLPVVVSDLPVHLEVLGAASRPGRRIFPRQDERALATALESALSNDDEREAAKRIRHEVLARFSWDEVAKATEELYLNVLDGAHPRRPPLTTTSAVTSQPGQRDQNGPPPQADLTRCTTGPGRTDLPNPPQPVPGEHPEQWTQLRS